MGKGLKESPNGETNGDLGPRGVLGSGGRG